MNRGLSHFPVSSLPHNYDLFFFHENFSVCAKATTIKNKATIPRVAAEMEETRTHDILLTN